MKNNGYSLLEILVTLCVVLIITLISVTGFTQLFKKSQYEIVNARLMRAIQLARHEAMTHDKQIVLCQSRDQKTCSGEWCDGFVVMSDTGVVFSFKNTSTNDKLYWRAFPYYSKDIQFLPSGLPNFQNGTFWYCPENSINPVWAIVIANRVGLE